MEQTVRERLDKLDPELVKCIDIFLATEEG